MHARFTQLQVVLADQPGCTAGPSWKAGAPSEGRPPALVGTPAAGNAVINEAQRLTSCVTTRRDVSTAELRRQRARDDSWAALALYCTLALRAVLVLPDRPSSCASGVEQCACKAIRARAPQVVLALRAALVLPDRASSCARPNTLWEWRGSTCETCNVGPVQRHCCSGCVLALLRQLPINAQHRLQN